MFERKITSQGLSKVEGARPDPSSDRAPGIVEVLGGNVPEDTRGHESHGQTIHSLFELRNRSNTSVYSTDGIISPGKYGSYVIRANGSMSITLEKSPSVPDDQLSASGRGRTRDWRCTVMLFHATDTNVSWPINVKWGRIGYELSGDPAALSEVVGPPTNPRPAGTADLFELIYFERTGEWWAYPTHLEMSSADPLNEDPDATDPIEGAPDEDGAPDNGDTDHDYTDPITGDALLPEAPADKAGNLIALHDGRVSFSETCGGDWGLLFGSPTQPTMMSAVSGHGIVVADLEGKATYSANLRDWSPVQLESEVVAEVPLINADFETGDLTGWTLVSGYEPAVYDTVQPPQRDGSTYYLSRDWVVFSDGEFEIQQTIIAPGTIGQVQMTVSVDVYAEPHAQAELRVGAGTHMNAFDNFVIPGAGYSLPGLSKVIQNAIGNKPARLTYTGAESSSFRVSFKAHNRIHLWARDVGGVKTFRFRVDLLKEDGVTPHADSRGLTIPNFRAPGGIPEGMRILDTDGFAAVVAPGNSQVVDGFTCAADGEVTDLYVNMVNATYVEFEVRRDCSVSAHKDLDFYILRSVPTSAGSSTSVFDTQKSGWHTISAEISAAPGEEIDITLGATGNDADVYFDNVRVDASSYRDETVMSVCRDLVHRRHIIATAESIHALKAGAAEYLGPAPVDGLLSAVQGDTILLSDGQVIAISEDNGMSFTILIPTDPVVQLFAAPMSVAVLQTGEVLSVSADSLTPLSSISAESFVAWDARSKRWLATSTAGVLQRSQDLVTWEAVPDLPASISAGDRKLVAADIGRLVGWAEGSKDLFHLDSYTDGWKVSPSLTLNIIQIQEIK